MESLDLISTRSKIGHVEGTVTRLLCPMNETAWREIKLKRESKEKSAALTGNLKKDFTLMLMTNDRPTEDTLTQTS